MKYELIIEHEGTVESVVDFAKELRDEFGVQVKVNGLDENDNVIRPLIAWESYKTDKVQTGDKTG